MNKDQKFKNISIVLSVVVVILLITNIYSFLQVQQTKERVQSEAVDELENHLQWVLQRTSRWSAGVSTFFEYNFRKFRYLTSFMWNIMLIFIYEVSSIRGEL
ncbi:hypothetical protein J2R98_001518 [Alkalibacillus filiformis]|uniref:Uncharacterized protein n=1 Tax=Alkalibacillus filiformis TaxID=200990 RepID=A0ABU0DTT2_9BACI|nr:hypothetical protein [Alkalibacillus filiformis]MDQ0351701.1 hypothetical protein [Alkalibacillus filiformis]